MLKNKQKTLFSSTEYKVKNNSWPYPCQQATPVTIISQACVSFKYIHYADTSFI